MALSRSAIAAFHAKGLASIADALGTQVTISGRTFYAHVSTPQVGTEMNDLGGFNIDREITLRWPVGRAPKPSKGTTVLLVAENLTYTVESVTSLLGSPLGNEIKVTAVRATK
jgi:hypothetical protein